MSATQQGRMMSITTPLGEDFLLINKFSATEALSELFQFEVELLHEETEAGSEPTIVDIEAILGQVVNVTVTQKDGTTRIFNGIVNHFSQGNRDDRFSYYHATVVPKIWLLTQIFQSRIFQHLSVPDILKQVFEGYEIDWKLQGTYNARNYCVQYQETNFDFVSRLMEEEGIYYYFEHTDDTHKMVVADTPQSHLDCPSKNEIPFMLEVTPDEDWVSSIGTWQLDYKLQSGKITLWDHNFELPQKKLEAEQPALVSIGGNEDLEVYEYPAGYARKYDGIDRGGSEQASNLQKVFNDRSQTAKIRMQERDAQYKTFTGMSDCCSITAGHRFKLFNHPNKDFNVQYTLISVTHQIEQSPDYVSEENIANAYGNSFTCIMHGGSNPPFRPVRKTSKPFIRGSQTAHVVGPVGEEIFTDKYGRVKVQFQWDREGEVDANSSSWVRVRQSWAGNKWGMMFIPRIGMEVVVEFLEGDPDQPIISGCVYNPGAMPPYTLPDEKTKMTIKSDSSPGGQGFNELRFEDKKGQEQVFIHAEKDMDVRVKADCREYIGNDQHLIIKSNRREKISGDTHLLISGDHFEKIEGERNLEVGTDEKVKVKGDRSDWVDGNWHERSTVRSIIGTDKVWVDGTEVLISASANLTLRCQGSSIVLTPGVIFIEGKLVNINSGAGPSATGASTMIAPTAPAIADEADDAKPGTIIELQKRSAARKKEKKHKEDKNKKSWIKIKMIDEEGKPVPGVRYKVTTPEGRVKSGSLNMEGKAHVKGFDPGTCKVTFPDLDQEAWEDA